MTLSFYREIRPDELCSDMINIQKHEAVGEAPILWPPDAKNQFIGKDPDGKERLRARGEGGDKG